MTLRHRIAVIPLFLLAACSMPSARDSKSVKKITDFWGGTCSYSVTSAITTEKGKQKIFTVILENSGSFKNTPAVIISSNMALTIYNSWTAAERESYTDIKTVLKNGKDTQETVYTVDQLKSIKEKEPFFDDFVTDMNHHAYDNIFRHMDKSLYGDTDVVKYHKGMAALDSMYGAVKSGELVGFYTEEVDTTNGGKPTLSLFGLMERGKNKEQLMIAIDPAKRRNEAYLRAFRY